MSRYGPHRRLVLMAMYHACPCIDEAERVVGGAPPVARPEAEWICGLAPDSRGQFGGAKIWRHRYKLSTPGRGVDRYLLNEHHHSISQDSFV